MPRLDPGFNRGLAAECDLPGHRILLSRYDHAQQLSGLRHLWRDLAMAGFGLGMTDTETRWDANPKFVGCAGNGFRLSEQAI